MRVDIRAASMELLHVRMIGGSREYLGDDPPLLGHAHAPGHALRFDHVELGLRHGWFPSMLRSRRSAIDLNGGGRTASMHRSPEVPAQEECARSAARARIIRFAPAHLAKMPAGVQSPGRDIVVIDFEKD